MSRMKTAIIALALATASVLADPPTTAPTIPAARAAETSHTLSELRFNGTALSDCIDYLSDASGASIVVNWRALDAAKVAKDTPITLRLNSVVSLRTALKLVLQDAGGVSPLTYYVDDGIIQITTQDEEDKQLITRTYPIQDLLFQPQDYTSAPNLDITQNSNQGSGSGGGGGGQSLFGGAGGGGSQNSNNMTQTRDQKAADIIKMITTTIRPEIWKDNGGPASISFYRDHLVVTAPRSVHELLSSQSIAQ